MSTNTFEEANSKKKERDKGKTTDLDERGRDGRRGGLEQQHAKRGRRNALSRDYRSHRHEKQNKHVQTKQASQLFFPPALAPFVQETKP
jgi:hypothetical protein